MIQFTKDVALGDRNIPFGFVEVQYPERNQLNISAFRALVDFELNDLRKKYADYDRKTVLETIRT